MTYETAEKLKNAGYPQGYPIRCPCGNYEGDLDGYCGHGSEDAVYLPTLSELIEACGRRLASLEQFPTIMPKGNESEDKFFYRKDGTKSPYLKENHWSWRAVWFTGDMENMIKNEVGGDSPEEAVANLWLKLNK